MSPWLFVAVLLAHIGSSWQAAVPGSPAVAPVQTIVTALQNLLQSVEQESQIDATNYRSVYGWCSTVYGGQKSAKEHYSSQSTDLDSKILVQQAVNAQTKDEAAQLEQEAIAAKQAMEQAEAWRRNEHEHFIAEQAILQQTLVLATKGLDMLDSSPTKATVRSVADSLHRIASSSQLVSEAQRKQLALLAKDGGGIPASNAADVERVDVSGPVQVLKELADAFHSSSVAAAEQERQALAEYDSLVHLKQQAVAQLTAAKDSKNVRLVEGLRQVEQSNVTLQDSKILTNEAALYLLGLQGACGSRSKRWSARSQTRDLIVEQVRWAVASIINSALKPVDRHRGLSRKLPAPEGPQLAHVHTQKSRSVSVSPPKPQVPLAPVVRAALQPPASSLLASGTVLTAVQPKLEESANDEATSDSDDQQEAPVVLQNVSLDLGSAPPDGFSFLQMQASTGKAPEGTTSTSGTVSLADTEAALGALEMAVPPPVSAPVADPVMLLPAVDRGLPLPGSSAFQLANADSTGTAVALRGEIKQVVAQTASAGAPIDSDAERHRQWCVSEIAKNQDAVRDKSLLVEGLATKIDVQKTIVADFESYVQLLARDVQELQAESVTFTKLRSDEQGNDVKAAQNYNMAQQILHQAAGILGHIAASFGKDGNLRGHDSRDAAGFAAAIDGLGQVAQQYVRLAGITGKNDRQAEVDTGTLLHLNEDLGRKLTQFKSFQASLRLQHLSELDSDEEERGVAKTEVDSLSQYLVKLQQGCADVLKLYDRRRQRHDQEVDALNAAQGVMDGDVGVPLAGLKAAAQLTPSEADAVGVSQDFMAASGSQQLNASPQGFAGGPQQLQAWADAQAAPIGAAPPSGGAPSASFPVSLQDTQSQPSGPMEMAPPK